jgi:ABC-type glycerol-3-phosphate transport system substrate-binding protein
MDEITKSPEGGNRLLKKCLLMTLLLGTLISGSAYADNGTDQVMKHKETLEFFYIPSDLDALKNEKEIIQKWAYNHPEISIDEIDLTQNFSDALKKVSYRWR